MFPVCQEPLQTSKIVLGWKDMMLLKYCRLACRSLDDTLFRIRLYRAVKVGQLEIFALL